MKSSSDPEIDLFARRLLEMNVNLVLAGSEEETVDQTSKLVAGRSWTAWSDPLLDRLKLEGAEAPAESAQVSLIRADIAVAATGTIGFVHREGRPRATALLPEAQIAVLDSDRLVGSVAEALDLIYSGRQGSSIPSNLIFVTGPSRTADIELRPIIGVHSPKELSIVIS